ncbi:hypothetical protein BSKO_06423 [Bryopsis sp. KO-2023]|nr:hypothetical protein BSKO_06423 [Bryopsis sp. KO-2023]
MRNGFRVIGLPKKQHLAEQDFVITRRLGVVPHSTSVNGHGHINGSGGSPNGHAPPKVNGHTNNNGHMNGNHMNGTLLLPAETSIEKFDEEEEIVLPCDGLGMNRWIPQKTDRTVLDPAVFGIEMYVRDYELDQYNVVNHSIFVNYLDHARHEFLSRVGCHPDKVADDGKALAIIRQDMRYWAPLRARSKFRSTVRVVKITKARCIWEEEIWKVNDGSKPDELIASAETEGICLNEDYRPIRIPKHILVNFEEFRRGPDICLSH